MDGKIFGMNKGNGQPIEVDEAANTAETQTGTEAGAAENASAPVTSTAVAELEAEIERLKAENRAYLERAARMQAEFDNFRKRSSREMEDFRAYALENALKQLLPILDSLDRALKTEAASAEDFRSGIELIDRQFHDVLGKLGVEPVEAAGKPFDPALHQAIQMVDTTEVADNHVFDELQRGYKIKDRLLRPAMVRVAQNPGK